MSLPVEEMLNHACARTVESYAPTDLVLPLLIRAQAFQSVPSLDPRDALLVNVWPPRLLVVHLSVLMDYLLALMEYAAFNALHPTVVISTMFAAPMAHVLALLLAKMPAWVPALLARTTSVLMEAALLLVKLVPTYLTTLMLLMLL